MTTKTSFSLLSIAARAGSTFGQTGSFRYIVGDLQAWDFANGTGVYSQRDLIGLGSSTAGVHTDGGIGGFETFVTASFIEGPGSLNISLSGQSFGNGAWSTIIYFSLEDSTGLGWMLSGVSSSAFFENMLQFEEDPTGGRPGAIINGPDGTHLSDGDYMLRVYNEDYQNLFAYDRGPASDESWTDATGSVDYTLTHVPAPAGMPVAFLSFAYFARRDRRTS